MTGEEMERAIGFILEHQSSLETRIQQTQEQLAQAVESIAELNRVVQMQSVTQSQLNETLTRSITALAEAQSKTEAKVDRLAGVVEKLVERLGAP